MGVDNEGQTVPGAQVPFGFASVNPNTTDPSEKYTTTGYDSEGEVLGFIQTHVSGTGGRSKYGNFRMTPLVGELTVEKQRYLKGEEEASSGYYSVTLEGARIGVELTATRLCGLHRYTFPAASSEASEAHVILDATSVIEVEDRAMPTPVSSMQRPTSSEVSAIEPHRVEGSASCEGGWAPGPYTLYFHAQFDRPFDRARTWAGEELGEEPSAEGGEDETIGAYATYDLEDQANMVVQTRIGISFRSVEKARENIEGDPRLRLRRHAERGRNRLGGNTLEDPDRGRHRRRALHLLHGALQDALHASRSDRRERLVGLRSPSLRVVLLHLGHLPHGPPTPHAHPTRTPERHGSVPDRDLREHRLDARLTHRRQPRPHAGRLER